MPGSFEWCAFDLVTLLSDTNAATSGSIPVIEFLDGSSHALGIARVSLDSTVFVVNTPMPADSPALKGVSSASPRTKTVECISLVWSSASTATPFTQLADTSTTVLSSHSTPFLTVMCYTFTTFSITVTTSHYTMASSDFYTNVAPYSWEFFALLCSFSTVMAPTYTFYRVSWTTYVYS